MNGFKLREFLQINCLRRWSPVVLRWHWWLNITSVVVSNSLPATLQFVTIKQVSQHWYSWHMYLSMKYNKVTRIFLKRALDNNKCFLNSLDNFSSRHVISRARGKQRYQSQGDCPFIDPLHNNLKSLMLVVQIFCTNQVDNQFDQPEGVSDFGWLRRHWPWFPSDFTWSTVGNIPVYVGNTACYG